MHALGQAGASKPGHAQVLHGDRLVLADQPKGELVVVIGPPVADLAVRGRDPHAGLGAVGRALGFAGELPLGAGELPLCGAQVPRVGNLLDGAVAGGDRSQPGQAEVDPGGPGHRWQRGRVPLDHERGVAAAVGFAEDGDAGWHRRQRPRPAHPQLPDLGHRQPGPVQGEAVAGEPDRLAAVLAPEPRVPDPAALAAARARVEPVAVGTPCVLAGLDQRDRGDLGQPRPLRGPLGLGDHPTLQFGVAELLPGQGGTAPFGEGVVVDHPGAPNARASA
jgi:hypothetical protein